MDFQAPRITDGSAFDQGKLRKLAQRVEHALNEKVRLKEPKQLDPRAVLVAPLNRDGAPPNVQHVHQVILRSFLQQGYDRTRPQVGICVEFKSEEGKRRLLEHNRRFSKGDPLLPPIDDSQAMYGSLAGSHLNIALRILQSGTPSPIGDLSTLTSEGDASLKDIVTNGHRWWILPEDIPAGEQMDISVWRNQDQNENQGTNEIAILQTVACTAAAISEHNQKVTMCDLTAMAAKRSPSKLVGAILTTLAKYYVQFLNSGDQYLVQELVDYHARNVNPREITVSNNYFATLVAEEGLQKAPFLKHYLLLSQYTPEKVRAQSAGPSICAFIETQTIVQLVKKPDQVAEVETQIREMRDQYLGLLEKHLSPKQARLELQVYVDLVIRCLLSKAWPDRLRSLAIPLLKYSPERVKVLGVVWGKYMDGKYPDMAFASAAGLLPPDSPTKDDCEEVVLDNLRHLKRRASDDAPQGPGCGRLQRGDRVTVVKRMTWTLKNEGQKDFRRDIVPGTEGTVEGYADPDHRQVLVKITIEFSEGPQQVVYPAYPRNLQLTKDYQAQRAGASDPAAATAESIKEKDKGGKARKGPPDWLVGASDPADVKIEGNWVKCLGDADTLNRVFFLKSRVGMCLAALLEVMPKYTPEDLVVAHRQNSKGVWRDELWTNRNFAAHELVFAPLTSQLKDTHLTAAANAIVGLPRCGRGSHPERQEIALDGRARTSIAPPGAIDDNAHAGSLFWLVSRTSDASEGNMSWETSTFADSMEVNFACRPSKEKKRKLLVDWASTDLPTIPLLTNKKAIKAHTRLLVFQAESKTPNKTK